MLVPAKKIGLNENGLSDSKNNYQETSAQNFCEAISEYTLLGTPEGTAKYYPYAHEYSQTYLGYILL